MPPTTPYKRGDVVLVNFLFSEETGAKRRPALVVSSDAYQQGRQEIIIAAITSNVGRLLIGDHSISNWDAAGLLYPSVVTGIIRTTKQSMVYRRLGALVESDMHGIEEKLRQMLEL
ncbi:MAG: type II toxin-antitoxin system PemK/MazF family toxin [Chloroflexi bacterium]|nr:type II toxin-antitoxin system PemK/MazF family toxin [Chloroflexota bacterium]